jgi:predicted MFS family arabinose efflux permease
MACVGIVAALTLDLSDAIGVSRQEIGIALSVFSLPSALGALICGGIVDRVGARNVILFSCVAAAIGDLITLLHADMTTLTLSLAINGIGFTGISVAAPALIVTSSTGAQRTRAMSIWSTYAPTAFALGLLIGAPFAGSGRWVPPLAIHATLMALLAVASLSLPQVATHASQSLADQFRSLASLFRQVRVLRLAIVVAVPSALSYGTSLISPTYIAQAHGATMGTSATAVAAIKGGAMLLCGIATGALLSRSINSLLLFAGLAVIGLTAQVAIFWPGSTFLFAVIGLFAWLIAFGGMSAIAMSLLPSVVKTPSQTGIASGFVGQALSILSFFAPSIYFGMNQWSGYVMLAGGGLLVSTLALSMNRRSAAAA